MLRAYYPSLKAFVLDVSICYRAARFIGIDYEQYNARELLESGEFVVKCGAVYWKEN